jgi:defect-in-organelle-trafficking protein DotD
MVDHMMIDTKFAVLISASLLLSGCAVTTKSPPHQTAGVRPDTAGPNLELTEAAVSVSRSLNELSAMTKASQVINTTDMAGAVSVDWSGPVEPLLRQIAKISGYRLRVLGVNPAIPVLVTVNAKDLPLGAIIRDIDLQSGRKAYVKVFPQSRIIELCYMRL